MPHATPLLATLAAALLAAWILGLLAQRLRFSPIVGYLLAGVAVGPYTPGFMADVDLAAQLAEVGVVLLMFGVGLHFHVEDLMEVRGVAIPGVLAKGLVVALLGVGIGAAFGWPVADGLVLGIALSVASTVVLLRGLEAHDLVATPAGRMAIGWLIVEDLLTVIVLVAIPPLALSGGGGGVSGGLVVAMGGAVLKLVGLVTLVFVVGRRVVPWILVKVARLRSRELFTLTVLAITVGIASLAAVFFSASVALGAFLAGMVVGRTRVSQQAAADLLPLRDAFAVLFFVSVGMLFDPAFPVREPWLLLAALTAVVLVKPLIAFATVLLFGYSTRTALVVATGLGQIGEFSFILGALARQHGFLSETGSQLLVACALASISINPFLFDGIEAMERALRARPRTWRVLNYVSTRHAERVNDDATKAIGARQALAVIVGFGPVGQAVDRGLRHAGVETVVIDTNMDTVAELAARGRLAIYGDAAHDGILRAAGIDRATQVIVTLPHSVNRVPLMTAVRQLNPKCRLFVRARYLREREDLVQGGAYAACFEEAEAAVSLTAAVLADLGTDAATIATEVARFREETAGAPFSTRA